MEDNSFKMTEVYSKQTMAIVAFIFLVGIISLFIGFKGQTSDKVERVLNQKMAIIEKLSKNPLIIAEVQKANSKNMAVNEGVIGSLESLWSSNAKDSEYIRSFMENSAAQELKKFTIRNHQFKEIFVTDNKGFNVAMTNKTSDFYQADEKWWVDAKNKGPHYNKAEYDASAEVWSYPICVPIKDAKGNVIGIMKSVLDISLVY